MRLIKKRTDIAFKLLAGSALWVRRLTDLIAEYAKAVPARLAGYLLAEALRQRPTALADGARVRLAVNKGELAAHLGTVPETLSRAFAKLRDEGVIEVEEREITIRDLAALRDLASWIVSPPEVAPCGPRRPRCGVLSAADTFPSVAHFVTARILRTCPPS